MSEDDKLKPIEKSIEGVANTPNITSVQAAALFLSGGLTDDPELATTMDRGQLLNEDKLLRADLRRKMGFDFELKVGRNYLYVKSLEGPKVSSRAKLNDGLVDDSAVERLVYACLKLKRKWDTAKEQADAARLR